MRTQRQFPTARRRSPTGAPPGQIIPAPGAIRPTVELIAYGPADFVEKKACDLSAIRELRDSYPVVWVDVSGLGDADLIASIGDVFGLHRLALEDVVNTHQRPKVEEYDGYVFLIAQMLRPGTLVETGQVSFFLGKGYLVSFQEGPADGFEPVRGRIRRDVGRIRGAGPDYLCYALIDSIIDAYFPALETHGEALEVLEGAIVTRPEAEHVGQLHDLKRDLLMLRRAIWPHREMINELIRDEQPLISTDTRLYLRDCYDHTIQLMDIVETYREIASGLLDVYISSVSAKLNEIMKVLTIIATVFIPLGFVASLYGMNFDRAVSPWNMPELGWRFGYPLVLLLMLVIAGGLMWYFWRKGWLSNQRSRR